MKVLKIHQYCIFLRNTTIKSGLLLYLRGLDKKRVSLTEAPGVWHISLSRMPYLHTAGTGNALKKAMCSLGQQVPLTTGDNHLSTGKPSCLGVHAEISEDKRRRYKQMSCLHHSYLD
ncbi:hypothetical protein ABVT39_008530 [Epinephelus coioides]